MYDWSRSSFLCSGLLLSIVVVASCGVYGNRKRCSSSSSSSSKVKVVDVEAIRQRLSQVIPYFPFKGITRFYDIGGFLKLSSDFQLVIDVLADRYKDVDFHSIGGLDARG